MSSQIATQPHNLPFHITTEGCSGGTYIVTGANVGLGFEAVKHLVAVGAKKVIMGVRNLAAGERAEADIQAATGKTNITEVWSLDLASYDSVKAFAKRAVVELNRIDALIENAAVAISERATAEGHVLPVTVNVLSTFLLGVLLLPKMSESAQQLGILPHIAVITSQAGFDLPEDWRKIKDDPLVKMDNSEMVMMKTYPLTKLMEIFLVRQMAKLIPVSQSGVVINLVCPGLCKTSLSRNAPPDFRENLAAMNAKFGRTAEDGSRTLLHGAVAGKDSHGCLLSSCEIARENLPSWITDEEGLKTQEHVWDIVAAELEYIEPGCVKAITQS